MWAGVGEKICNIDWQAEAKFEVPKVKEFFQQF
jgi:hypothetical protein